MSILKQEYAIKTESIDAPPSYDLVVRSNAALNPPSTALIPLSSASSSASSSRARKTFKPIVIPQTSKSFQGPFFSPFCRAWAPALAESDITQAQLLAFIDGLNEAFIAHPTFQVASAIGGIMSFAPAPVTFVGIGLQVGAGLASAATSWARARAFVKEANEKIFLPKGLRAKVLKTKKMMLAVGQGGEVLRLPPLVEMDPSSGAAWKDDEENDPRMRRIRALGDRVAELQLHGLPEPEEMRGWWKKLGSRQAQKRDEKMHGRMMKKRENAWNKMAERNEDAEKEASKGDREIRKIEREKTKEIEKAERKLSGRKGEDDKKRREIEEDLSKELRKLDREMEKAVRERDEKIREKTMDGQKEIRKADEKEGKVAMKIYWIVIDKAESLDKEFTDEEDVESLDSK
ncbi:hypothetical protein EG329_009335 [Mollisiaceae sp. DMI_Dod_QoI]|nr:hypothetical protein EG329_009335 [Helotiales sp. DMI_Dod_QoI]